MKFRSILLIAMLSTTAIFNSACKRDSKSCEFPYQSANITAPETTFRPGGGSSGMEQISGTQYLAAYDLKRFEEGPRMGMITVSEESLIVKPISVTGWDSTGISSDLESICKIPGRPNEFLLGESGAWQDKTGRIFHVSLDTTNLIATVMGHSEIPMLNKNDIGLVGDQYEAMLCVPFNENEVMILLGERGGSQVNPNGIIRWAVLNLETYAFEFSPKGLKGIEVVAPGTWDQELHRHITDFFLDKDGFLWTAGCEDTGDWGPFYSIIYKVGKVNADNHDMPIDTSIDCLTYKVIDGFKIEALSGPDTFTNATLSFGTEDENYGGVWRPILL